MKKTISPSAKSHYLCKQKNNNWLCGRWVIAIVDLISNGTGSIDHVGVGVEQSRWGSEGRAPSSLGPAAKRGQRSMWLTSHAVSTSTPPPGKYINALCLARSLRLLNSVEPGEDGAKCVAHPLWLFKQKGVEFPTTKANLNSFSAKQATRSALMRHNAYRRKSKKFANMTKKRRLRIKIGGAGILRG